MKRFLVFLLASILCISILPQVALAAANTGDETVYRVFGSNRYATSKSIADKLMEESHVKQFDNVIVASGENFPDALTGSYLSAVTGAPIILTSNKGAIDMAWFKANVADNANVYILGGTAVVPEATEAQLETYNVERLAGSNRYLTNLNILQKALALGGSAKDILVCTGSDFADSLSASATGKAILLVRNNLTEEQKAFLGSVDCEQIYVLGGTSAVDANIEKELATYGSVQRISGSNRYETSVKIAEAFFPAADRAVLAYAKNFPDGLCGGSLAFAMDAPLILTASDKEAKAASYAAEADIHAGIVLGGEGLISDNTAKKIFDTNKIIIFEKQAGTNWEHDWTDATCIAPKICKICGATEGVAAGHSWKDASCTDPKTCMICGVTEGGPNDHDWMAATCLEPKICEICGATEGVANGHDWNDATCTAPKNCKTCGATEGTVADHSWKDATCTDPKTCVTCGTREGRANGHIWKAGSCRSPKTCQNCGVGDGNGDDHDWKKLRLTEENNLGSRIPRICKRCLYLDEYTVGEVDFAIRDTLPNGNGKKVKIILLGGQSNASGSSQDAYLKRNVSPEKYEEYNKGYDNVYINYYVSGAYESQGFVKCATRQGEVGTFFGPELGLAEKLNEMYPDETFFIVKYAWGGSNLFGQWLSPSSDGETGVLYKQFVKYVQMSIQYLMGKNYDVEIEGMCWMQGESDSFFTEHGINYKVHLSNFIQDIRNQFAPFASPDGIAFIDACIADNPAYWVYCDLVNQSKQEVVKESPMNALIDTNAHGLTCSEEPDDQPDMAHYDSLSEIKLGNLFAEELARYID